MRTLLLVAFLALTSAAGCSDTAKSTYPEAKETPSANPPGPDGKPGKGRIPQGPPEKK